MGKFCVDMSNRNLDLKFHKLSKFKYKKMFLRIENIEKYIHIVYIVKL